MLCLITGKLIQGDPFQDASFQRQSDHSADERMFRSRSNERAFEHQAIDAKGVGVLQCVDEDLLVSRRGHTQDEAVGDVRRAAEHRRAHEAVAERFQEAPCSAVSLAG
jgi:hypothetical protein